MILTKRLRKCGKTLRALSLHLALKEITTVEPPGWSTRPDKQGKIAKPDGFLSDQHLD